MVIKQIKDKLNTFNEYLINMQQEVINLQLL